jgi:hypothetical protein
MYDPSNLTNPIQQVRYLLGGAKVDGLLADAEIAYELANANGVVTTAAIACGEYLIAQAGYAVDLGAGSTSVKLSQLLPQLTAIVTRLRTRKSDGAGAAALANALLTDRDGNRKAPAFTRTLGDNPRAGDWPVRRDERVCR